MTAPRTTVGTSGSGSGLTRLRMGDEIFSHGKDDRGDAYAGFIIIRRGEVEQLPKPPGPMRLVAGRTG